MTESITNCICRWQVFQREMCLECCALYLTHLVCFVPDFPSDQFRCGAHSDYGSVTFVFQDGAGGLEVRLVSALDSLSVI